MVDYSNDKTHIEYVRQNVNPLYKLDKEEAMKYAVSMGASDSARGIGQLFGKAGEYFGWDGLSEKLKEKDKKLKAILESEEYGKDAMIAFLGSAVVADPVSYVPIVGWLSKGKKAKNLMELTKYGAVSGAAVSSLGYTAEDERTLLQDKDASLLQKRLENTAIGAAAGTVLAGGGGALVDVVQKARGKGSIFKTVDEPPVIQTKTVETVKEAQDNIIKETSKTDKTKYNLKSPILKKYQDYVGTPVKNAIFNNPGESLGFIAGYNGYSDPEASYKEKITSGLILAASIKGAKNIKYKDDYIKDIVGRGVIDSYGLTPDYIKLKQQYRINKNEIGSEFYDILARAEKDLSPEQNKLLYNFMVGDIQGVEKLSPEALAINDEARKLITKYANEFTQRGLVDANVVKQNINTYLKRSYLKPKESTNTVKYDNLSEIRLIGDELKPRGLEEKITLKSFNDPKTTWKDEGWKVVEEYKDGRVKIRRDFTKDERVQMQEIEDASYAIAETGRLFANDLSTARFFDELSQNPNFVLSKDKYKSLDIGDQKNFVLVPDVKVKGTDKPQYGQLNGMYVNKDVFSDLKHIYGYSKADWGRNLDGLQNLWKKTKTAWNFGTHVGNTASNVMLIDFADADLKYVGKAWKEMMNKNSAIHKQAKLDGIFDADFISREFRNSTTEIEKALTALRGDKFGSGIVEKTKQVVNFGKKYTTDQMEKLYQFEDQVFRMAVYMDRLDKGYSQVDAALDARKWFIDYDINAPVVKLAKRTFVPFVSYTYRVIPLLAEAATLRPHKFAKWAAFGHAMNEGSAYLKEDKTGEQIDRLTMREQQRKRMFGDVPVIGDAMPYTNIRIPFDDDEGNALYFDVSRWIPGGDIFEQRESSVGIPGVPSPLQPGGLYVDAIANFMFKTDPFTGQSLEDLGVDTDSTFEIAKHFGSRIPPNMPFIKGTYAYKKYEKAKSLKTGQVDSEQIYGSKYVAPDMPWASIAYGLGFKLRPQDAEVNKLGKELEYKQELKKLQTKERRILSNFKKYGTAVYKSTEERDKELEEVGEEIIKLSAEYEIYLVELRKLEGKQAEEKSERLNKFKGGEVDVPYTKDEPEDRVDPFTGQPYSDQMARLGFLNGEKVNKTEKVFTPEQIKEQEFEYKKTDVALNRNKVLNHLRDKGLSKNAIIGLMANIDAETGLKELGYEGSFDYRQKQIDGPGKGLFMLDPGGDHVKQYNSFLKRNNREDSTESQLDYALESIYDTKSPALKSNGSGNARELRAIFKTGTPEQIAEEFAIRWERPKKIIEGTPEEKAEQIRQRRLRASKLNKVLENMFQETE
jgi:hypothetical protein